MKKTAICFTEQGRAVIEKLNNASKAAGISGVEITELALDDFAKTGFEQHCALIFVGAAGIAVRAIAPHVKDKLYDSPVIVIDDSGSFVIPILSGHVGGANKLAVTVAHLLDAVPVITTSSDVNGAFSADVFAKENNLKIRGREGIRKVSAKAIEGKPVTLSVKDYPPDQPVDIIVADETDREYDLLLSPKRYVLGIGLRKGADADRLEEFVLKLLSDNKTDIDDVYAAATIDIKQDEPALRRLCDRYGLPLIAFDASVLKRAPGTFTHSDFVEDTVGVDNVCERAAVLAAGPNAQLVLGKTKGDGITIAIARKH